MNLQEYNAVQPIQESDDKICQNDQVQHNDKNNNQCKKTCKFMHWFVC